MERRVRLSRVPNRSEGKPFPATALLPSRLCKLLQTSEPDSAPGPEGTPSASGPGLKSPKRLRVTTQVLPGPAGSPIKEKASDRDTESPRNPPRVRRIDSQGKKECHTTLRRNYIRLP